MSGPSQSLENSETGTAQSIQSLMPVFQNLSNATSDIASGANDKAANPLSQPGGNILQNLIQYYSSTASGNPQQISQAIAPQVNAIQQGTQQNANNINASMPRGGVRDLALALNQENQTGQVASATNTAQQGGLSQLFQLGTTQLGLSQQQIQDALSAYGLSGQELGGAVTSGTSAASIENNVLTTQAQQKGAQMGLLGSLAGAGATLGGAGILSGSSGGAGSLPMLAAFA